MLNVSATTCTCRGYDPADPCGHGDVADGCPAHDPTIALCGSCEEFMPADGFVECESCGDEVCGCCAESGEQERETGWSADLCPSCADPDPSDAQIEAYLARRGRRLIACGGSPPT